MPVFADTYRLELPSIEPVSTALEARLEGVDEAYPFPVLRATGTLTTHEIPTFVIEQECLRVAIAPDLGGRIVSLFDRRFQRELLEPLALTTGRRGVRLEGGIELSLDGRERLNSMGPVDFQVLDEEDAVILGELSSGSGLSWHLRVSLAPNRASVQIGVRVANRTLEDVPYRGGLLVPSGIHVVAEPGVLFGSFRNAQLEALSGRQVDNWMCELVPSDLPRGIANGSAVSSVADGLHIEALEPMIGHKVAIQMAGETLALVTDLYPEIVSHFDLDGVPDAVAILSPEGEVKHVSNATYDEDAIRLRRRLLDGGGRGAGYVGLAQIACRKGSFEEASGHLDDALTFNGDDPLAWWLKAVVSRHLGKLDERSELLNAHFVAPFEPALRAESFLSTGIETKEASALVRPLSESPDAMVEVAVLLAEVGLWEDLARWIDECLRHREIPMLRYVLADALLSDSRMEVEAAQHVRVAEDKPVTPPYPWRAYEIGVLRRLALRFPQDPRIRDLLAVAEAHRLPKI